MNFRPLETSPDAWTRGLIGLASAVVASLGAATGLLFVLPGCHDEFHFCHGAWLSQSGLQPFSDYLWHNSTGILYMLRSYALWDRDFGAEILIWGRVLCAVSMWFTAYYLYRIGTLVGSRAVGLLAVFCAVPLWIVPRNPHLFYKQTWCVRPEVLAMPLALASLYLTLIMLQSGRATAGAEHMRNRAHRRWSLGALRRSQFAIGLLTSSSAGLAFVVSPRFVHFCGGIAVLILFNGKSLSRSAYAGMIVGLLFVAAVGYALVDLGDAYTWIGKYGTMHRDANHGRFSALRMHAAKFLMAVVFVQSAIYVWRKPSVDLRRLAIVQLILSLSVFTEGQPSVATYTPVYTLGTVLFAYLMIRWAEQRTLLSTLGIAFLVMCLIYPQRGAYHGLELFSEMNHPRWLPNEVAALQKVCDALQGDTVLSDPQFQLIAARDASYYWTQFARLTPTFERAHIDRQVTLIADCRRAPPAILWKEALDDVAASADDRKSIDILLEQYEPTSAGFLVRRDLRNSLMPIFDDYDVAVNLTWPDEALRSSRVIPAH